MALADVLKPTEFIEGMAKTAKSSKQHLVLPEGDDARVVEAAGRLLKDGICRLTILGNPQTISDHAKKAGVSLEGATIIDYRNEPAEDLVKALYEERKKSGMTMEKASELIHSDRNYFGTMLIYTNKVNGMVSGADTHTADTLRPGLQVIKAAPGVSQVSSVFFMVLEDGLKIYSDSGLVIDPDAEQLAEIGLQAAKTARAFGLNPRVAFLSYVTGADSHAATKKTRDATEIAKKKAPQELIEGPLQYDAAVSPRVAASKFKQGPGPVAGRANVCIFPDLNAGNIGYKICQQSSGCIAIGPIMVGFNKPINDLSRGCTVEDCVQACVVTCLQCIAAAAPASKL